MTGQVGETPTRPLRKVLAIAGGSDDAATLAAVAEFAARHDAELSVLACVEPPSDMDRLARSTGLSVADMTEKLVDVRHEALVNLAHQTGLIDAQGVHVTVGKPFLEISRHVATNAIDLVVKTAERLPGSGRFLFASTDQHLVRKCPCAVWLRLPDAPHPPMTILATVDVDDWDAREPETLSALNRQIVETALRLAHGPDAVIHVLHAWDAPGEGLVGMFSSGQDSRIAAQSYVNDVQTAHTASLDRLIAPYRARATETGGPRILSRLGKGAVRSVISDHADSLGADILVMGTVARTGISGILIGNTAEDILNTIGCSVMTVKPEGFVSPLNFKG